MKLAPDEIYELRRTILIAERIERERAISNTRGVE